MLPAASSHHLCEDVYPLRVRGSPKPQPAGEIRYEARNANRDTFADERAAFEPSVVELVDLVHVRLRNDVERCQQVPLRQRSARAA